MSAAKENVARLLTQILGICYLFSLPKVSSLMVTAYTGKDIVAALQLDNVDHIIISVDNVRWSESDWDGREVPVVVRRNVTIRGNGSADTPDSWPVFDFGFVSKKVRLGNQVTITFQFLVVANFRYSNHNLAPGCDFLVHCSPGETATVVLNSGMLIHRICYPPQLQTSSMSLARRPPQFPGNQTGVTYVDQSSCINASKTNMTAPVPLPKQCWPVRGRFVDTALYAADVTDNMQATVFTGYFLSLVNVDYGCAELLRDDCIHQLGHVGCWNAWLKGNQLSVTRLPVPTDNGGGHDGGMTEREQLGIILGCVLGGLALMATGMVLLLMRRGWKPAVLRWAWAPASSAAGDLSGTGTFGKESAAGGIPKEPLGSVVVVRTNSLIHKELLRAGPIMMLETKNYDGLTLSTGMDIAVERAPSRRMNPVVVVTPLTPHRDDVQLDMEPQDEVRLLPRTLGKGGFGKVVEGEYRGQRVAVKVMLGGTLEAWGLDKIPAAPPDNESRNAGGTSDTAGKTVPGDTHKRVSSLLQEVEVLGRCQHPNVVRLLAACLTPPRVCLVMELMDTSLEALLYGKTGELLAIETVLGIALDVARGLEYLHPTIVHRDLKPANVLIQSQHDIQNMVAKLSDFGLSRLRNSTMVTRTVDAGTPHYMAPELFDPNNQVVTHKADIYSFGVLLWSMLTGMRPWQGDNVVLIAIKVHWHGKRLPLNAIPESRRLRRLEVLILSCWDHDPARRPAAAEVVKLLLLALQDQALQNEKTALDACAR